MLLAVTVAAVPSFTQSGNPLRLRILPKRSASPRPAFSAATAPTCVDAQGHTGSCDFQYFGGPVIANVDVVVVYWGNQVSDVVNCGGGLDPQSQCIGVSRFFHALANSTYIDILGEYNTTINATAGDNVGAPGTQQAIGRGTLHPGSPFTITVSTPNAGSTIHDSNVTDEIQAQVTSGSLPAPSTDSTGNVNTLYVVYFPPGVVISDPGAVSCHDYCAYHGTYASGLLKVPYGVIPDFAKGSGCDVGCGHGTQWENLSSASSHEFAEAVTDAAVGLAPANASPLAWYDVNNGEIADVCNQHTDILLWDSIPFTVQEEFSRAAYKINPNAGCVPPATPGFTVSAPAATHPATPFSITVHASNSDGSLYLGTAHFTSSDGAAAVPADYTFTRVDAGSHTFTGVTLTATGSQNISVSDAHQSSTSGGATVLVGGTAFQVSAPGSVTAGAGFNFTVTAIDLTNNSVAAAYTGTVHFTSTDAQAVLPADATLTNGTGQFAATLKTAAGQTITATDTVTAATSGSSATIAVAAGPATHLSVTVPATATAGASFNFNVTALDAFGNTATGYGGTVHFTSSDAQAVLPANAALTNGVGTFSATLKVAAGQSLTATDTVNASISGNSASIAVKAGAAAHFLVTAPATATAGTPFNFAVSALDTFNNTATAYGGTVHFSSSDPQAALPANALLINGAGTFSATLKTAATQTITAADAVTASIQGTSNAIAVSAGPATHLVVSAPATATSGTAFGFTVTAFDAANNVASGYNGPVHFTSSDGQAIVPANSPVTNGSGSFSATLKTPGAQTLTVVDAGNNAIAGTSGTINTAGVPNLSLSAPAMDFGTLWVGTDALKSVTITNTGNGTLHVLSATANSPALHVDGSGCQAVLPAATCTVTVAFAPLSPGPTNVPLLISSDAPGSPATLTVTGSAIDVSVSLLRPLRPSRSSALLVQALTVPVQLASRADPSRTAPRGMQVPIVGWYETNSGETAAVVEAPAETRSAPHSPRLLQFGSRLFFLFGDDSPRACGECGYNSQP